MATTKKKPQTKKTITKKPQTKKTITKTPKPETPKPETPKPETPKPKKPTLKDAEIAQKMKKSPIFTIRALWNISPQPVKPEYRELVEELIVQNKQYEILPTYFDTFVRGRHFTWQQYIILRAVEDAIAGKKSRSITISSGHGIGKSTTMSWLMIWFLMCYPDCRIPCTAPTTDQLQDVLWMEIQAWISRFPDVKWLKDKFDLTQNHIRVNEEGNSAFARARTARKEKPEALSGLHSANMMMVVDEASGVPDEIYNYARGAFTEENVIVLLISNPTRNEGYFFRTHNHDEISKNWQRLSFSTNDSPLKTSEVYAEEIAAEHGIDSDEYRIRVLGKFPRADSDDNGWFRLLEPKEIEDAQAHELPPFIGKMRMGIDPSGEGSDTSRWVGRDRFQMRVIGKEKISNPKSIAEKTLSLLIKYPQIETSGTNLDNFGVGAEVTKEIALAGEDINGINVGDIKSVINKDLYSNKRAEAYMTFRRWVQSGGKLCGSKEWNELSHVRFKRGLNGKIKIMSKEEAKRKGYKSPNTADAGSLTFITPDEDDILAKKKHKTRQFKPSYAKVSYERSF
ncbi:MAG: hypothetical protein ACTSQH_00400 [Candidatus Hodarchaeales archaeon]